MPLKSPVRKIIRNLKIKKTFPKYRPENTLIYPKHRLKDWRKGDYIEMYFGRLIAFQEIRELEKE